MLMMLTPVVMGILFIVIFTLRHITHKLEEFDHAFHLLVWVSLILIVGTAVYLSYATPTFAQLPYFKHVMETVATPEDSNLLQE